MKWENLGRRDYESRTHVRDIPDDELVCRCRNITAGEIRKYIGEGASALEQLQEKTGAGTGCGLCVKTLQRILDYSQLREPGPGDIEFIEKRPHGLPEEERTLDEKCADLPVLEIQTTEWVELRSIMKKTVTRGFPDYSQEVNEWIKLFLRWDLGDPEYAEHYTELQDRAVETLSRDEILTVLTWYIKEERKRAGLIAQALEDGTLPALTQRLHNITS